MDAKLTELIIRLETRTRQLLLQYSKSQDEKKELLLRLKERELPSLRTVKKLPKELPSPSPQNPLQAGNSPAGQARIPPPLAPPTPGKPR